MRIENVFRQLEDLAKKNNRKRLLRRGIALLSAVVLLFTVNTLKRNAVAMQPKPTCGYDYDHSHTEACFDENGMAICGLHEHTDDCFQNPNEEAAPEELEVELGDVTEDGAEDLAPEAIDADAAEAPAEEIADAAPADYTFDLNGQSAALVSDILAQAQLPVAMADVQMVGLVDDAEVSEADDPQAKVDPLAKVAPLAVALVDGDISVTAMTAFDAAEIAIVTENDIYTVRLLNGAPQSEVTDETVETGIPENSEVTDETVEAEIPENSEVTDETVETEIPEDSEVTDIADEAEIIENSEVTDIADEAEIIENSEVTDGAVEAEVTDVTEDTVPADEALDAAEVEEAADEADAQAETAEVTENAEQGENAEVTEPADETENNENAEVTEPVAEAENNENGEVTEPVDEAENAENGEVTEPADEAENAENGEVTEPVDEAENAEDGEVTEPADEAENAEDGEVTDETAEDEDAIDEALYPAQSFEQRTASVLVNVTAEAGAFPADTTMSVKRVWDRDTLDGIADAVTEDFVEVKRVMAVDITFYNAEGEEIEPLRPVSVVMTVNEIEENQDAVVVHMDDEGNAALVEQSEAPEAADARLALNVELPAGGSAPQADETIIEEETADETTEDAADEAGEEAADEAGDEASEETADEAGDEAVEVQPGDEAADEAEGEVDDGEALEVEPAEAAPAEAAPAEDVAFEADAFSVYAVVVTETIELKYIAQDGKTFDISVGYGPEAAIPAGATLRVEELTGEAGDAYLERTEDLLDEGERITLARYFDITILDEAGQEVQPAAPVRVVARLADDPDVDVQAVHFADEGEAQLIAARRDDEAVAFSADSFSVYGIVYTVDFYYDVDGKTFEYHINGGDVLSLRALLPILRVVEDDPETEVDEVLEFAGNIRDVRFSDETLVRVVPVAAPVTAGEIVDALGEEIEYSARLTEDDIDAIRARAFTAPDWALVSLKPFTSHESLTITLKDGEVVTVKVEDASSGYFTVQDGDWNKGHFKVSSTDYYVDIHDDKIGWNNGKNKLTISAVPADGYAFDKWRVRVGNDEHDSYSFFDSGFPAGTFDMNKLSSGEVFIACFKPVKKFTVRAANGGRHYERGTVRSKYIDPNHKELISADNAAQGYTGYGVPVEGQNGVDRFAYPFFAIPFNNSAYKFAFWMYEQDGQKYGLSEITDQTIIPYNGVVYEAYFIEKNDYLFYYKTSEGGYISGGPWGTMSGAGATAIPYDGYTFIGWYDENGHCLSANATFDPKTAQKSAVLTARFGHPSMVNINISVNDANMGDVVVNDENNQPVSYLGTQQTKPEGTLDRTITATPREGYAFTYWTLNGYPLPYENPTLSYDESESPAVIHFSEGDNLQAVFKPYKVIDANDGAHSTIHVSDDEKQKFEKWLKSLKNNKSMYADKTAQSYDYDNRMYQIDITAESARVSPQAKIGLAFILDASNSMQFPSNLQKTDKTMVLNQSNMNEAFPGESGPYYIISEPTKTATVYRLFKESNTWYAIDDSYYYGRDGKYSAYKWVLSDRLRFSDVNEDGSTLLAYPIYRAVGDKKRVYYLNQSMNDTMTAMRDIVTQVNSENYDILIAHTKFAAFTYSHYDTAHPPVLLPKFQTENFKSLKDPSLTVNLGDTDGGTRHDLGLQEAYETISWDTIPEGQRYAVLISDGAAVIPGGSNGKTWDGKNYSEIQTNIVTRANMLKNDKKVKLITVGLSTRNVEGGSNVLRKIASPADPTNPDGEKLFFEAESGEDLENILYKILQTVVKNQTCCGKVEDTVDKAFYPVLADGTPVPHGMSYYKFDVDADGKYIVDANGRHQYTRISKDEYDRLSPWGSRFKWEEKSDGQWKITWESQYFGWDSTDPDPRKRPWHETFYVKAKEDFLGGNAINTNDGNCVVTEEGHSKTDALTTNFDDWDLFGSHQSSINLPTPHVNVDELSLTKNDSEWTVYLGTNVNPLDELKQLYREIDVNEVVTLTQTGGNMYMQNRENTLYPVVKSNEDGRAPKDGATPETFKLNSMLPLTDDNWSTIIEEGGIGFTYSPYGHNDVGRILIVLNKAVEEGETNLVPSPHNTAVVGDEVEKYTLTISYVPNDENRLNLADADWHTTHGGVRGKTTDWMQSINTHIINVFAKKLKVQKVNETGELLSGAEFALVKAKDGKTVTVGDASTYDVVQTLTVDETDGSLFSSDWIARPAEGEQLYLIETRVPQGYTGLSVAVPVELEFEDQYWVVPRTAGESHSTSVPINAPYDWQQLARLTLDTKACSDKVKRTDDHWVNATESVTLDSKDGTVYYKVANNAGVSLPATGGMGTGVYTLAGAGLVLAALALLIARRRRDA